MSLPKLSYDVYDRCIIMVGSVRKPGVVIGNFTTPYSAETQYIIYLDDVTHPNFEVRDALCMSPEAPVAPPIGDRKPAALAKLA